MRIWMLVWGMLWSVGLWADAEFYVAHAGLHRIDGQGARQWSAQHVEEYDQPVTAGELVLAGSAEGLFAYDRHTGRLRWREGRGQRFSPRIQGSLAYVGGLDGHVRALALQDGQTRWQRRLSGWVYSPAVLDELLVTGGSAQTLWALDRRSGELRWARPLTQELVFRPVATPLGVVVTTFDGGVSLYNHQGERLWHLPYGVAVLAPRVSGDLLLLAGLDGRVSAHELSSGKLRWQRRLSGRITAPPRLTHERLWVHSEAAEAVALNVQTGQSMALGVPRAPYVTGQVVADQFVWLISDRNGKQWRTQWVSLSERLMTGNTRRSPR